MVSHVVSAAGFDLGALLHDRPPLGFGDRTAVDVAQGVGLTGTHAGRNPGDQLRGEVADRGIVMAVAGHQLIVVVALGWLSWQDIRRAHDSPGTALSVAVLAVVGVFAALVQG